MNYLMSTELCMVEMLTYFSSTVLKEAGFDEETVKKMLPYIWLLAVLQQYQLFSIGLFSFPMGDGILTVLF